MLSRKACRDVGDMWRVVRRLSGHANKCSFRTASSVDFMKVLHDDERDFLQGMRLSAFRNWQVAESSSCSHSSPCKTALKLFVIVSKEGERRKKDRTRKSAGTRLRVL